MRRRRTLYVELNRRVEFHVYKPVDGCWGQWERSPLYSDYFVLTVPPPDSLYEVWMVKTLTVDDAVWVELTEDCVIAAGLDARMTEDQIAAKISDYQLHQSTSGMYVYEREMTKFSDEYGRYDHQRWLRLHGPEADESDGQR